VLKDLDEIRAGLTHDTQNDLPVEVRENVCRILAWRLADAVDLMLQAKHAHWNVKGPGFIALHELFDKVHGGVGEYVDLIAERIAQLGGTADGLARSVAAHSSLPPYPGEARDGMDHVHGLSSALAAFGRAVRNDIDDLDECGDAGSADIMTEVSRGTDRYLWLVEAHTA
jgi:starvation-inducible DNA-binding protein